MAMKILQFILFTLAALLLTACSGSSNRYYYADDHTPDIIPTLSHLEEVNARYEPYSAGGNKDYNVRGIDYKVLKDVSEFSETGYASWYGNKFHGHLTSNGERYNMFSMSAAHKNLPLPSYVEVTNLENNRSIVVRVNDRGPFHEGRIIDLSYAAADKLDVLKHGTAKVRIKLLHFPEPSKAVTENYIISDKFFIQYLVTSKENRANEEGIKLSKLYQTDYQVIQDKKLYRLRLGPLFSQTKAKQLLKKVQQENPSAYIVHIKK